MGGMISVGDFKLTFLLEMSKKFNEKVETSKVKRDRSLTTDTSKSMVHTRNGLVDWCQSLLTRSHDFIMLGNFSTHGSSGKRGLEELNSCLYPSTLPDHSHLSAAHRF